MIVGLGNPGREYANTPHNVGFVAADTLCKRLGADWRIEPRFKADVAKASHRGEQLLLVRPMTYMNLSGEAVGSLMRYFRMTPADVTIIADDVNLPAGRIRMRTAGSAGGHNGLKSIIEHLGTQIFTRIRIGVGRGKTDDGRSLVGHVLGRIAEADAPAVAESVEAAADAALFALDHGPEKAMTRYNTAPAEPEKDAPAPVANASSDNSPSTNTTFSTNKE